MNLGNPATRRRLAAIAAAVVLVTGMAVTWFAAHQERKIALAVPAPSPITIPTATSTPIPSSTATPTPFPTPSPAATPTTEGDAEAAFTRGYASYSEKEYEQSISDYTEAIRTKPDYADAYNNRGLAYDHIREYDKAISDYTEAIRLEPNDARYHNDRGFAYDDQGEYDRAISDYTEAIRLDSTYTLAYINRGVSYFHRKKYDEAILTHRGNPTEPWRGGCLLQPRTGLQKPRKTTRSESRFCQSEASPEGAPLVSNTGIRLARWIRRETVLQLKVPIRIAKP